MTWTETLRQSGVLSTDCFRLFRGDPSAENVDIPLVLDELGRAVAAVSALCGGAPAGVRVRHGEQRRLPLMIQVLPKSPRSGLLTPEGAVRRIAREFPGSRMSKWVWPSYNSNNDKE